MTKRQKKAAPKLKKINVSSRYQWKQILKDVEKDEIPVDLLLSITVNLIDGTKVNINVKELIEDGTDPETLEHILDFKFRAIDAFIKDIDFYVNVDHVVASVQPITDEILKDL